MAVFGVPTVHEDDALRAVRAAAELRDSLASLNDELERDYGVALQLRTGVNTGEVVTGTEERLATGDAVNVAARLEQAAQPGEILIGEQTLRLARGAIEVEPVEPLSLKGKAEPLACLPAAAASSRAHPRSTGGSTLRSSAGARSSRSCARRSRRPSPSGVAGSSPCSGRRESASRGSPASSRRL